MLHGVITFFHEATSTSVNVAKVCLLMTKIPQETNVKMLNMENHKLAPLGLIHLNSFSMGILFEEGLNDGDFENKFQIAIQIAHFVDFLQFLSSFHL